MLSYYLLTAFKSIRRNIIFSVINIFGLSLGLMLVIVLFTWLSFETSFDTFHKNADRIFRVIVEFKSGNLPDAFAQTPAPLGDALKNGIPEVEDFVRFGYLGRMLVNHENEEAWEEITLADPSIFKIFSFELLSGNPETALKSPGSIVLSETKARKYFGNQDPLGQTLILSDSDIRKAFTVTGVMKDIPLNSQIQADIIGSFSELKYGLAWGIWNYTTYILARTGSSFKSITAKLPAIVNRIPEHDSLKLHIQALTSIHLHSDLRSDLLTNTNLRNVYIISSILILVLLLACINYMNLSTARFTRRGKEGGLRKISGATNANLIAMFLFESFAVTLTAFCIALLLSYLIMPEVVHITGLPLTLGALRNFSSITSLLILLISISVISGSYPAFMFSSVNPISAIRDELTIAGGITIKRLRKGLVVFQFIISITLIAITLTIKSQMEFIRNKNLGLNSGQIIVVPVYKTRVKPKYELFRKEILTSPLIRNATAVMYFAEGRSGYQNVWWEGLPNKENNVWYGDNRYMSWLDADPDFLSTMKIDLVKGEFLPDDISRSGKIYYVLNETAVKQTGWKDPLGKQFNILGPGEVIGVVRDFNFKSLHTTIEPLAITYYPKAFDNLLIRISAEDISGALEFIKGKWESLFPSDRFEYTFLNDDLNKQYIKETTFSNIITALSILALIISCIGLFGLVLFTLEGRIKEIGIRKVSGSSTGTIVLMLNLEFFRLIILAFLISSPIIFYSMHKWLTNFAYRIEIGFWIFVTSGIITLLFSLLTISWHTWKFSLKNPVECLKYE